MRHEMSLESRPQKLAPTHETQHSMKARSGRMTTMVGVEIGRCGRSFHSPLCSVQAARAPAPMQPHEHVPRPASSQMGTDPGPSPMWPVDDPVTDLVDASPLPSLL